MATKRHGTGTEATPSDPPGAISGTGRGARMAEFVRQYQLSHNASEAARKAGYPANRAARTGSRLLRRPDVQTAIARAEQERTARLGITADRVLQELALVAFSDPAEMYDSAGGLLPLPQMTEAARRVVSEHITEDTEAGRKERVKRWDKVKALELLGKTLGLYQDRTQIEGAGGGPVVVEVVSYADAPEKEET